MASGGRADLGGQLDEALGAANLAVATAPDMPETNDALGQALQAMNAVSQSRGERRVISSGGVAPGWIAGRLKR